MALVALALFLQNCCAQPTTWKVEKNVEIIVGTGPGGANDLTARTIQRALIDNKLVGMPVNVVNKPGGGGVVAGSYLNQHPGDGHFIFVVPINLVTDEITGRSALGRADITPISQLLSEFMVFSVRNDSFIKSARDLIARLKADPGSLSFAISPSLAGANHISIAMALKSGGVDIRKLRIVVFDSTGAAMTALLGGHVDIIVSGASSSAEQVKAGQVRGIAVTSSTRLGGVLSSIPTWKEQGVNSVTTTWRTAVGPKGMTVAQVAYWEEVFAKLSKTSDWTRSLQSNLWENDYMPSRQTVAYLESQYQELKGILTELGLAKRPQ